MADTRHHVVVPDGECSGRLRHAVTTLLRPFVDYRRLAWLWVRAFAQYRLSLILMSLAVMVSVLIQVGAVVILFGHAGTLAGFTVMEGLLVFGLASSAFGTADMFAGSVERLGNHIRSGTLDSMLIRPVSPLVQVAADEFSPRRLGKVVPSLAILSVALVGVDLEWSVAKVALLALMMLSGTLICAAIWVITGCLQFFVAGAREAANSLTYGGQALTEYPIAIYGQEIVRAVTYVVPLAFISWQPALLVLDRTDPLGMPEQLRYMGPAIAVLLCACAALTWRFGLRHYRSTGSWQMTPNETVHRHAPGEPIIEAVGLGRDFVLSEGPFLRRTRRTVSAVGDVTFTVRAGEIVGYLGPNGAGKSSTMKMLTGILTPTSGTVRVAGMEPARRRTRLAAEIGVVFGQRTTLWWDLPLRDSLSLTRHLYRVPKREHAERLAELTELLELGPFLDTPVRQLSLGQRMRGDLTAALLHAPRLLVLDEPTIGLDVVSKSTIREFLLRSNAERGTTILITTHDLGDVERLCDRVMVIDHGRLAFDGDLPGLRATVPIPRVLVVDLAAPAPMIEVPGARAVRVEGPRQWLELSDNPARVIAEVARDHEVVDLTLREPDIEAVVSSLYRGTMPVERADSA